MLVGEGSPRGNDALYVDVGVVKDCCERKADRRGLPAMEKCSARASSCRRSARRGFLGRGKDRQSFCLREKLVVSSADGGRARESYCLREKGSPVLCVLDGEGDELCVLDRGGGSGI